MTAEPISPNFRQLIQEHFSLEDLRALCFDLTIDYEELGEGIGKSTRVIRLIEYTKQHHRLKDLLDHVRQKRPNVAWPDQINEANLGLESGRLVNVPPLPPHFLSRETDLATLRQKVLAGSTSSVAITGQSKTVGVQGMGGIGKSVLATALAHDKAVRAAFPDGVFWLELGQTPNLLLRQSQLAETLGDGPRAFEDAQQGKARLSQLLADKTCLVILDDVWQMTHAQVLDGVSGSSGGSRLLITTRDNSLLTGLGAIGHRLDALEESQALALLADWSGQKVGELPAVAIEVARRCDYLPLVLSLCGAQVRDGTAWKDVLAALAEADLSFLDHPYGSVMASMHLSVAALPEKQRELYQLLAAVPEDTPIPEAALVGVWRQVGQLNDRLSRHLLAQLVSKSLLRLSGEEGNRFASLHDLQHLYLRQQGGVMKALHERWLAAYAAQCPNGWASGPDDGYFFQHLAYHLHAAGRYDELRRLLLTFAWLQTKLESTDVIGLEQDYGWLIATAQQEDALWLVRGAIRLSVYALAKDKNLLAGQLRGRLLQSAKKNKEIANLLAEARGWRGAIWLCPLQRNLTPPGGLLLRTLVGHAHAVNALAIVPNGQLALSASRDETVKVWEIATGREVCTFTGHTNAVNGVAVTPDGRLALSASGDKTVKMWEIVTGREVRSFQNHTGAVKAVAITADGRLALSASENKVKVWEIATGQEISTFQSHTKEVSAVTITPDSQLALSTSENIVEVWKIATGQGICTFQGHTNKVNAVTVTPNGRLALSASGRPFVDRGVVKVWEITTGREVYTFQGHNSEVNAVTVTPNGRLAFSASWGDVKVWEIATGREVYSFQAHTEIVNAVAVTPDGRLALSASDYVFSENGEVKVWEIPTDQEIYNSQARTERVNVVAVTPNGRLALSTSSATPGKDEVKVWEVDTGREVYSFQGHNERINSLAVTPDGLLVLSASKDMTVKVWEIATGQELRTFKNHTDQIDSVVVMPDGKLAISASQNEVKIWEVASGREICTFEEHTLKVKAVTVTPDGRLALSAYGNMLSNGEVKVWEIATGREVYRFQGHAIGVNALTVTPDGRLALSASWDRTVKIWEVTSGRELHTLKGHLGEVRAVVVTPDGRLALSASDDQTLKVWDLAAGQTVAHFQLDYPITSLATVAEDMTVVAGDEVGKVHFFRLVIP